MAVTPKMIATALGVAAPESGSTTEAQWQMWIADALMLIDARKAALGVATDLDAARVDYVVRQAVVSHIKHPDDTTQVAVAIDDGNVSRTYRSSRGRIEIADEWWTLLGLTPSGGQAFAVDTVSATGLSLHPPFCDLYFGGATCSCGVSLAGFPIYELGPVL